MKKDPDHDAAGADAFAREMADVVPLEPDPRGRSRVRPAVAVPRPAAAPAQPEADEPGADFAAPGVDRREIRKLKRGEYTVEERRDLHGMTAADACAETQRFIDGVRKRRRRCVCIVHGRGLHSEQGVAILKTRVRECLRSHRAVLAYADAPRWDGGSGAVYVLVRR